MGRFIFSNQNTDGTTSLYSTDGTASGTVDLEVSRFDFTLDPGLGPVFVDLGGKAIFLGDNGVSPTAHAELFSTDGTVAGTVAITAGPAVPQGLWTLGSQVLTSGPDQAGAPGLWVTSDATRFTEIKAGVGTSDVVVSKAQGYFAAVDAGGNNAGLWRTDGTAAGTSAILPAGPSLDPQAIVGLGNGRAVFANQAADGTNSLWVTDGTAAGTRPVVNAALGADIGPSFAGALANGKAVFTANDASGMISVWATDGTAAGTTEILVNGPDNVAVRTPGGYVPWNNKLLFSSGYNLLVTDGTKAGTVVLSTTSAPNTYLGIGKTVFFTQIDPDGVPGADGSAPFALYVSNGTAAGTHALRVPGLGSLGQSQLTQVDGKVVFSALDASGAEALYSTDGTVAGTHELALPAGITLDPNNPPSVAALPGATSSGGVVTLGGGTQVYNAASGTVVQAGSGQDTVVAASGHVTVTGGAGHLSFIGGTGPSSVSGGAGSTSLFSGSGGGHFTGGSAGHNILVSQGAAGANTTLTGAAAGDLLFGSAQGNDVLVAGAGRESIIAGAGHETITGGATAGSVIFTGAGTDSVTGGAAGGDTVVGGSGRLFVTARNGDAVFGGAGGLTVQGSAAGSADSIVGGAGSMSVTGHGGNMLVVGGAGMSSVDTGNGASLIFGGSGRMNLTTGTGSTQVVLGAGGGTVTQGSGVSLYDVINASPAGGSTVIEGFRPATDRIDLFGYKQADVGISTGGGQTTIQLSDGKQIYLVGVSDLGKSLVFG